MTVVAKDVMSRASIVLQDSGAVRWPATELHVWLNDGQREIALHKPSAVAKTAELSLSEGTWQSLDASYISLIRVTRNLATIGGSPSGRTGGRAITPIVREVLDTQIPNWQDPSVIPNSSVVKHVIQDMTDPRSFWVVPGNDGTGIIEAIVAAKPSDVAAGSDVLDIETYSGTLDVPDIFQSAIVDYILYRAFSKDMNLAGSMQRAQAHYQQFANAIGMKVQSDTVFNLSTTGEGPAAR